MTTERDGYNGASDRQCDRIFSILDARITREVNRMEGEIAKITARHGQVILLLFSNLVGIIVLLASMLAHSFGKTLP